MARRIDTEAVNEAVRLEEQGGDIATPDSGYWALYAKSTGVHIIDDGGVVVGPVGEPPDVPFTFGFHVPGVLSVGTLAVRLLAPYTGTIYNVAISCNTAPTGADLIVDINNGGSTIFTTQGNRPTVAAGANDDTSSVPDVTAVTQNDVFTLDIDQIGSTVAGADLNVQIRGTIS